jgi:peroxiredoxin
MMQKPALLFILSLLFGNMTHAQNDLKKCSDNKQKQEEEMVKQGKMGDSASLKKFEEFYQEWKTCVTGKPIPDFIVKTIKGEKITNADIKGKVVVFNFWYVECPPCMAELPGLNQLAKEYKDSDVVFLGCTFENPEHIKKNFFDKKKSFDFTIIPDAGLIEEAFGVSEHPSMFVVDKNGKVISAWTGGSTGADAGDEVYNKLKPFISSLLHVE